MERYEDPKIKSAMDGYLHPGGLALTDKALTLGAFSPGAAILDIGAGYGETVRHLRERWQLEAVGLEPSPVLRAKALEKYPDLPLVAGYCEALPFPAAAFDGVLLECVFSLFADPLVVLAEIHRVLRPGGTLIISDLYQKKAGPCPKLACFQRLKNVDEIKTLLGEYHIVHFSDESEVLTALVMNMIWNGFSPAELFGENENSESTAKCSKGERGKPGYYLLIAKRRMKNE